MVEGPTLESICSLLRSSRFPPGTQTHHIKIEESDDNDDWVCAAVAYYKATPKAEERVTMKDQPAVDTGGVRRQMFSVVFETLAYSENFRMFEGLPDHLRPAFRISNLSSEMFKILGQMIAHSLILDGQGFPFLSECIYYYLAGQTDKAVTLVSPNDVSESVRILVRKVYYLIILNCSYNIISWDFGSYYRF